MSNEVVTYNTAVRCVGKTDSESNKVFMAHNYTPPHFATLIEPPLQWNIRYIRFSTSIVDWSRFSNGLRNILLLGGIF